MLKDRRKYPRKEISCDANMISFQTRCVLGECFFINVSENGFAIETESILSIGEKISIKVDILNDTIFLTGQVVRADKGFFETLYGIKICEDECINFDLFRNYVKYQLN